VPRWSGLVLIVAVPFIGPIAYATGLGILQVAGYGLIALASIPVANALLRLGART
jgi:hypothetical protein